MSEEQRSLCERDSFKCVHQGADAWGARRVALNHRFLDYSRDRAGKENRGKDFAETQEEDERTSTGREARS